MIKNKIVKDTFFLTAVELVMQGMALILNIFITRSLGSDTIGIISLVGSFFMFVTIISSGNVYLSTSRFISEEIGKSCGDPEKVFRYGVTSSLFMSVISGTVVFCISDFISRDILDTPELSFAVKMLAVILPVCSLNSCLKGYFSAFRSVYIPSFASVAEFLVKSVSIALLTEFMITTGRMSVYTALAVSICAGQAAGFLFLFIPYLKMHKKNSGGCTISFRFFLVSSVPIFLNSLVTSVLSSANDALVPITLKQYGNSTSEAFSQFGIFEAIVIPALFFPSSILCSLSGILVPEIARERGADNLEGSRTLINKVLKQTFGFSVMTAMIFLCFGDEIGFLMSGEHFAGRVIAILSPAVPFIYLEIILEGILRGMGKHVFSSVNYLAEYTIRISVLLVCVPLFGFYGIVASYLASNIIGNISRLIMIIRVTGLRFNFTENVAVPVISGLISAELISIAEKLLPFRIDSAALRAVIFGSVMMLFYVFVKFVTSKILGGKSYSSSSSSLSSSSKYSSSSSSL